MATIVNDRDVLLQAVATRSVPYTIAAANVTGLGSLATKSVVSITEFASGIEPVALGTTLPTVAGYTGSTIFYNTTDGKLYRLIGGAWLATVPAGDLTGQLNDSQLASISAAKIAGTLSDTQLAAISASKVSGQLSDAQINAIAAAKITGQVSTAQIAAASVTASQIAANTIVAGNIAANAITTAAISAGAITAAKIAANTITAGQIAAATITGTQIAASTLTAANIFAGSITTASIAAGAITTATLAAGAVTAANIAANTITAGQIAAGAITATQIAAGAITATQIASGTITATQIAASTITAAQIAAGTITASQIAAYSITADRITATSLSAISATLGYISSGDIASAVLHGGSGFPTGGFAWPTNGGTGFHLSGSGLLLGNPNLGKYFQVTDQGDIYAPNFNIIAGSARFNGNISGSSGTFSGLLTAQQVITTGNIQNNAASLTTAAYFGSTSGNVTYRGPNFTSEGGVVFISVTAQLTTFGGTEFIYLYRDSVNIAAVPTNGPTTVTFVDTPGAGNHSYAVNANTSAAFVTIFTIESKR